MSAPLGRPFYSKREFAALIKEHFPSRTIAAKELGVTRSALYVWLDHGPSYAACAYLYTYLHRNAGQVLGTVEAEAAANPTR